MKHLATLANAVFALLLVFPSGLSAQDDIPRRPDGKPDLTGNYDIAGLTPYERDPRYGDKAYMTPEEAEQIETTAAMAMKAADSASDPNREAPPPGGDGSGGAAGDVGGYNSFWVDPGTKTFSVDGKFQTSIIYDPPNGRLPALTDEGQARRAAARPYVFKNTGTAWWLEEGGAGPYDNPESLATIERCLYLSVASLPARPILYNNLKTIVQTETHVMILVEWMHDARIIRLNSEHPSSDFRSVSGDSIGWWEGDTLVVETTNFMTANKEPRDTKIIERFSRLGKDALLYEFTVHDPDYTAPYSGKFPWPQTEDKLYEYACAEGNYAMGNILRGARLLEEEWKEKND